MFWFHVKTHDSWWWRGTTICFSKQCDKFDCVTYAALVLISNVVSFYSRFLFEITNLKLILVHYICGKIDYKMYDGANMINQQTVQA